MANAALTWRENARNSFTGTYSFSQFSYTGSSLTFTTTPHLLASSATGIAASVPAPPRAGVDRQHGFFDRAQLDNGSANAAITDTLRFGTASLTYSRGTNGGAGYLPGAESDVATANFSREFVRTLTIGFTGAYMRTAGLNKNGVTNSKDAGAQVTWRLGRYATAFAGYTAIQQSSSSVLSSTAISGLENMINFGVGYSPRGTRLIKR